MNGFNCINNRNEQTIYTKSSNTVRNNLNKITSGINSYLQV